METLFTTIGVVFVAELGDKTQLVALGLGARHRLRSVIIGVVVAYAATTVCSVVVGGLLGAAFPTRAINIVGGLLFLGFAIDTLRRTGSEADDEGDEGDEFVEADVVPAGRSIVLSVAGAMFIAELGDKTMIATATLAARDQVILVGIGALIGITGAGLIGVFVGRAIGSALPERAIRIGSAVLFAIFGVALLIAAR